MDEKKKSEILDYIRVFSQVTIPIVIAIFAWVQNSSSNDIQETIKHAEIQLELFKISWNSLTDSDTLKKSAAMVLLQDLDQEYAEIVSNAYANDPNQPEKYRMQAKNYLANSRLKEEKIPITIVYKTKDSDLLDVANEIKYSLDNFGLASPTTIIPDIDFYYNIDSINILQINYEEPNFFIEAKYLQSILQSKFPNLKFELISYDKDFVKNRSSRSYSIGLTIILNNF